MNFFISRVPHCIRCFRPIVPIATFVVLTPYITDNINVQIVYAADEINQELMENDPVYRKAIEKGNVAGISCRQNLI